MNMIEVKTAELSGYALDWAVGMAIYGAGVQLYAEPQRLFWLEGPLGKPWNPSADWSQGGPLISSNQVYLEPPHDVHRAFLNEKNGRISGIWQTYESWHATVSARVRTLPPKIEGFPGIVGRGEGPEPLIAACRAIVASHFGDTVQVPEELIK